MSISIYIRGIRDEDGKLGDMLDLKEQCDKLDIDYPPELENYFRGTDALHIESREDAIKEATEISLNYGLNIDGLVEGEVGYGDGAIVDLSKLPSDIKKLRIHMA